MKYRKQLYITSYSRQNDMTINSGDNISNASSQSEADYIDALRLYGLNARAATDLMQTFALDDAIAITKSFFEASHLSGFFRFIFDDGNNTTKFGSAIDRKYLDKHELQRAYAQRNEKICDTSGFIIFKTPLVTIFLAKQHLPDATHQWIRDIACLYLDSLHSWLENYMKRQVIGESLRNTLVDTIQTSSELLDQHFNISDELISTISARFPSLGLDEEQEEVIADIINESMSRHAAMIEEQIRRNNTLGDTLLNSVNNMCGNELLFDKKDHLDGKDSDLF